VQHVWWGVQASTVVFLIPKDEPVDMATDPRYAVMRSLQGECSATLSGLGWVGLSCFLQDPVVRLLRVWAPKPINSCS
jgi:hypothetical protein